MIEAARLRAERAKRLRKVEAAGVRPPRSAARALSGGRGA